MSEVHPSIAKAKRYRPIFDRKPSYSHCIICGREPKSDMEEMNWTPLRFWDPDDGYKIGTLCRWCWEDVCDVDPKPEDYAYEKCRHDACTDEPETDEDPTEAL